MREFLKGFVIISILIVGVAWVLWADYNSEDQMIKIVAEFAYMEGQIDALGGDVRVISCGDTLSSWIKSPWDDGGKDAEYATRIQYIEYMNSL